MNQFNPYSAAIIENARTGQSLRIMAIQATWRGRPVGLVLTRDLAAIYPSGTPQGTYYARFPGNPQIWVVVLAQSVSRPVYELDDGQWELLVRRPFENYYVRPSVLSFYGSRVPAMARMAVRNTQQLIRPVSISPHQINRILPAREREMLEFVRANRQVFQKTANAGKPARRGFAGFFMWSGIVMNHPLVRMIAGLMVLVVLFLVFRRQAHTLFGAITHFR